MLIGKDQFDVKGLDTTMGYCSWEGRTAKENWGVVATCESPPSLRAERSTKSRSCDTVQDKRWTYLDDLRNYQPSLGKNT
jgi:hypothetical protein